MHSFSRHRLHLGRFVLGALSLIVIGASLSCSPGDRPPPSRTPVALHSARGLQHSFYDGDQLRLRIKVEQLAVSNARLLGPFHIGFRHSLVAHDLTVERFHRDDREAEMPALSLAGGVSELAAGRVDRARIAGFDAGPVRVIQRAGDTKEVLLSASRCRGDMSAKIVCERGVIRLDGRQVSFVKLAYDGLKVQLEEEIP
jgi:hypothetical protein